VESSSQESFDHLPNALGLRIRHLQIDLGELRLAVGAQVFVAEATHNLKVLVESRDHQDLLEHLRRLRQGIERSRLHAAGYQIIACALRRRSGHEWRFDFEEPLPRKIVADCLGHLVPRLNVELHHIAAQVNVAVLQPGLFVGQRCIRRQEWRQLRLVQNAQLFRHQFHFARGHVRIDGAGIAQPHSAGHGDNVFVAQRSSLFVDRRVAIGIDHNLGHARAVPQIQEEQAPVVAALVHPPHEHGLLAGVGRAKRPAHMSSS